MCFAFVCVYLFVCFALTDVLVEILRRKSEPEAVSPCRLLSRQRTCAWNLRRNGICGLQALGADALGPGAIVADCVIWVDNLLLLTPPAEQEERLAAQ